MEAFAAYVRDKESMPGCWWGAAAAFTFDVHREVSESLRSRRP
jgi:hypothetical protein